ncbi:putative ABC1 protein [Platanthera guangdongensis]|uniref:ABC1 protein n=1 Tax=Platanthera guangdongensis TaxID=2320717 RepID=A0ABR2MJE9_9ASPA
MNERSVVGCRLQVLNGDCLKRLVPLEGCCAGECGRVEMQGSSLDSFFIVGRISSKAASEAKLAAQNYSILSGLSILLDQMFLEARLFSMKIALCLVQLRKEIRKIISTISYIAAAP